LYEILADTPSAKDMVGTPSKGGARLTTGRIALPKGVLARLARASRENSVAVLAE
jgi:hypothetical protein